MSTRQGERPVAVGEGDVELHLLSVPGKKVPVIKVLRKRMRLRLGAAYGVIDSVPTLIARDLEVEVAEEFRDELQEAGGEVELRSASKTTLRLVR